ncbi:pyrimidine 5'-nucleotidase [Zavarzinia compransoris]|uniref:Pyrimidine 5'-nucleotidase n=1 Tax=Zavarzinia compransoris TaxID=1264899 RepID=A0A317DVL0_9PROT|nr:pyrimidine 5'-nucleotidase [Zavarzinia compransoris]PWR18718.1 pyrimidine 5'-nucleotidase [Zavarzinia compransoris]TDP48697.1 putative hydrolase of the HAD superfamily [Zavarzinia compransoris]
MPDRRLARTETWVFDLDNTLYPASCRLFDQIEAKMRSYIRRHLGLDDEAARALKTRLFHAHGTTMKGLMVDHGVDPHDFLAFVHDIDLAPLDGAPALDGVLAALPGRKVIFTNGSAAHAGNVLARLGIAGHFDGVFDIVAAGFTPKPEIGPYRTMLADLGIDPARATMVEDMARNLRPAADLGMATVWIPNGTDWGAEGQGDHIHHVADDLAAFLGAIG